MSKLLIEFLPIDEVIPHPNAEKLEVVKLKKWTAVVQKGLFSAADRVIFIPPEAVLPKSLHEALGVTNYCAELPQDHELYPTGARRVKGARLRGVSSFGILLKPDDATRIAGLDKEVGFHGWGFEGDIAGRLGITKWNPPISANQPGAAADLFYFHRYTEIENWRNYSDRFLPAEKVVFTEKIHGNNARFGYVEIPGEGHQFMAGSHDVRFEPVQHKIAQRYWEVYNKYPALKEMLVWLHKKYSNANVVIFGEVFGSGVDVDLKYNMLNSQKDFRIFDISVDMRYLDYVEKQFLCTKFKIPMVPLIWSGPYSDKKVEEFTDGPSTFDVKEGFKGREGIVITPMREREDVYGRVILKSVSVDFQDRKGAKDAK